MAESNGKKLPQFDSIEVLTDFFDENDMGDYLESMPEVDFSVELGRSRHFIALDKEIADKLSEISKLEHTPSGAIVNSWLREKISTYSEKR